MLTTYSGKHAESEEANRSEFAEAIGREFEEPEGSEKTIGGVQYQCYNFKEHKELGQLITGYHGLWDYVIELEEHNYSLLIQADAWRQKYEIWKAAADSQKLRGDEFSDLFKQEHDKRLKAQSSDKATLWIPWTLVVVESLALAALGIYSTTL